MYRIAFADLPICCCQPVSRFLQVSDFSVSLAIFKGDSSYVARPEFKSGLFGVFGVSYDFFRARIRGGTGKWFLVSGKLSGSVPETFRKFSGSSGSFLEAFLERFWSFPEIFRKLSGSFPKAFRKFSGSSRNMAPLWIPLPLSAP